MLKGQGECGGQERENGKDLGDVGEQEDHCSTQFLQTPILVDLQSTSLSLAFWSPSVSTTFSFLQRSSSPPASFGSSEEGESLGSKRRKNNVSVPTLLISRESSRSHSPFSLLLLLTSLDVSELRTPVLPRDPADEPGRRPWLLV